LINEAGIPGNNGAGLDRQGNLVNVQKSEFINYIRNNGASF